MKILEDYTKAELEKRLSITQKRLEEFKQQKLNLNMARGNPSVEQLDMVSRLFETSRIGAESYISREGQDIRTYGSLFGIEEMRELFAKLLKTSTHQVLCIDSSSLRIEYDILSRLILFPLLEAEKSWGQLETIKFICPVPGYDRHFKMLEVFGIEMLPVPLLHDGPDMGLVKKLCAEDKSIKGIWTVPMYSNPSGTSYSEETMRELLSMEAADDFRILADMAYVAHHLYENQEEQDKVLALLDMAESCGNPDRIILFASTSKMTYPGAGVACIAMSENNIKWLKPSLSAQMISADKYNMMKHYLAFNTAGGVENMMQQHASILRPKFEMVLEMFHRYLGPLNIASWTRPKGGYFISIDLYPGTAKNTYTRCKELGLSLTEAGACFPHGEDPHDSHMRIAPSFPPIDELKQAIEVFCLVQIEQAIIKRLDSLEA